MGKRSLSAWAFQTGQCNITELLSRTLCPNPEWGDTDCLTLGSAETAVSINGLPTVFDLSYLRKRIPLAPAPNVQLPTGGGVGWGFLLVWVIVSRCGEGAGREVFGTG